MATKILAAAGLTLALATAAACGDSEAATSRPSPTDRVARGKYLVTAMGCNDCHTPWKMGPEGPAPDMTRMLSGHPEGVVMPEPKLHPGQWAGAPTNTAFKGPWGTSFTANLTPDVNTGLGIWTEDMFLRAIREGRHMGQSRRILPPMPWPMIRNLNDEDLKSIFAYLRSIPAIHNRVPEPLPPAGAKDGD
jgi:mono/diheme cytochrome c family protein